MVGEEQAAKQPAISASDLDKLRFDYAWKWFAYHAEQRMKAFNFMILTFGVLSTAIVTSVDRKLKVIALGLCLISFIVAFLFARLDIRNKTLVEYGRASLKSLESHFGMGIIRLTYQAPSARFLALREHGRGQVQHY